jgi:ATP/maltotriose-dependent transcriptional regulator MalT
LLAQRGDLDGALRAYADAIDAAHKSDDPLQEAMAHNNLAYHALLAGKLALAHEHIDQALALVDAGAIQMPRQYLYSTRGEIALAEQQWDEAEIWFQKGMAEAEKAGNLVQAANYQANLALVAQGRGDLDAALVWLESAQQAAAPLTAPHLQAQIDVWLCDLYLRRGERVAAREALNRAEARIEEKGYGRLRAQAALLRAQLG